MVLLSLMGLMISVLRSQKGTLSQQISLYRAKQAIERINMQIRLSVQGTIRVINAAGNPAQQGNRVEFTRSGETIPAAIQLTAGADGDFNTAWDNRLMYYAKASDNSGAMEIARGISTPDANGAFTYRSATTPLTVRMRTGDIATTSTTVKDKQDAMSGRGMQGVEINITVGPRNEQ